MKQKLLIFGAAALGVVLLAGYALAQTRHLRKAGFEHRHLAFLTMALDLTDAQVEQVKQIHAAEKPKYDAFRQQMKQAAADIKPLIATDNFDEAKVRVAIAQRQQIMQDMMVEHAKEMNAVYKILTPEQRVKAEKMFDRFGRMGPGHFGHGGHRGMHPDGPPPEAQN